jgi:hypothetical protein
VQHALQWSGVGDSAPGQYLTRDTKNKMIHEQQSAPTQWLFDAGTRRIRLLGTNMVLQADGTMQDQLFVQEYSHEQANDQYQQWIWWPDGDPDHPQPPEYPDMVCIYCAAKSKDGKPMCVVGWSGGEARVVAGYKGPTDPTKQWKLV